MLIWLIQQIGVNVIDILVFHRGDVLPAGQREKCIDDILGVIICCQNHIRVHGNRSLLGD